MTKKASRRKPSKGALDPKKDFNEPVKRSPDQAELLALPEQERPPAVKNGRIASHFVRFVFDKDKDRKGIAALDFSLSLEDSHKGELPQEVESAWKYLKHGSVKRIDPTGIVPQTVSICSVPDDKPDLELIAATFAKASLSVIQKKGEGKAQKVTRLHFRLITDLDKEVAHFCQTNYDETVWLRLRDTQRSLLPKNEEEESD